VARYNLMVELGADVDFKKPKPQFKIATPPFYAADSTPSIHDSRTGLWVNAKSQVVDMEGKVIPGLYAAGEATGGLTLHGVNRAFVQARLAAQDAVGAKI
jgi:succinate dehydrogenase/fumarate reductase flavoprotein subunit